MQAMKMSQQKPCQNKADWNHLDEREQSVNGLHIQL